MTDGHPLDTPVRSALSGRHRHFAVTRGRIRAYRGDVAPFVDHPLSMTDHDWHDLASLRGPAVVVPLIDVRSDVPWEVLDSFGLVQMTAERFQSRPDPEAEPLGPVDVPDILDLIARTRPGPFFDHTIDLGNYLGIRIDGRLVAMAGERMAPDGWTEISAVCTDPSVRGRGLATRLMRAVADIIVSRGDRVFLHASADNTGAVALYTSLGFELRNTRPMTIVTTPPA